MFRINVNILMVTTDSNSHKKVKNCKIKLHFDKSHQKIMWKTTNIDSNENITSSLQISKNGHKIAM